jgi:hypothetical protein
MRIPPKDDYNTQYISAVREAITQSFNEREVAGISNCRTKVLNRIHEGVNCLICGFHRCTKNGTYDKRGNRV